MAFPFQESSEEGDGPVSDVSFCFWIWRWLNRRSVRSRGLNERDAADEDRVGVGLRLWAVVC